MKTHLIKKLLAPILVVELPEGERNAYKFGLNYFEEHPQWEFLGKLTELQDEDVFDLVHSAKQGKIAIARSFKNYKNKKGCFVSALHSFLSAIESEVYLNGNPYGKPKYLNKEETESFNELFIEAESRTFDKSRTIIFKKV